MKFTQLVRLAGFAFLAWLTLGEPPVGLAGPYSPARAPSYTYRPAGAPVYGFNPSGQSFVYQQAGKSMYNTGNPVGGAGHVPSYRFDTFTAPHAARSRPPVFAPPTYFGGKLWSPRAR